MLNQKGTSGALSGAQCAAREPMMVRVVSDIENAINTQRKLLEGLCQRLQPLYQPTPGDPTPEKCPRPPMPELIGRLLAFGEDIQKANEVIETLLRGLEI